MHSLSLTVFHPLEIGESSSIHKKKNLLKNGAREWWLGSSSHLVQIYMGPRPISISGNTSPWRASPDRDSRLPSQQLNTPAMKEPRTHFYYQSTALLC